ncbi:MAG TPA: phage holin family protein [Segeticoccus sp.]|uniref:phage holin family protein n=1 Tax=Segeticoccus sp. TaxID=2706531 RepID=UPI002D8075DB|nr:phage holin family protein [Segeticoccus sp.]HET8599014.1 phage holin family protein [Segeticoccus sp.]
MATNVGVTSIDTEAARAELNPEPTIGKLISDATTEMKSIVRDEIALAKSEIKADAIKAGIGGAALAVAGLLSLYALVLLFFGCVYLLNIVLPLWVSFLVMGGFLLLIAGVLGLVAKSALTKIKGKPERTIRNAQETVAAVKQGAGAGSQAETTA